MKKIITIILALALIAALAAGMVACKKNKLKDGDPVDIPALEIQEVRSYEGLTIPSNFKIGMICLHDESSTYDLNFINAAKAAVRALGMADNQLIIKTDIDEGEECYTTANELVSQGCKVIFADSFGHEAFMIRAAEDHPDVQFCHATGTKAHTENRANYHNAFASIYEGRYLAGVAAGMKLNEMNEGKADSEKNYKIGYVGAFTYAEVISGYTSFYLGAKSVCPQVTMDVQFTGSWYDVAAEKEAAENLIKNKKCALISQHADSMGAPSACEAAGVPNVSYNGSTIEACPSTFIVSSRIDWTPYVKYIIAQTVENKAIATDYTGTLKDGSVALTAVNGGVMAKGTIEKLVEVRDQLVAGTLKVFDTSKFTVTIIAPSGAEGDFGTNTNATVDANGKMTGCLADVNDMGDYVPETQAVNNGAFEESKFRSAPYFDLTIDGITRLNVKM